MVNNKILGVIWLAVLSLPSGGLAQEENRPLMKEFIGLNGHFHFKPELYQQVCGLVRNYHNMDWDVNRPGDPITFPICANKVNWDDHVYGKWKPYGFEIDICAQFGRFGEGSDNYRELWKGQEGWIRQYGYEMAKYFGPSGEQPLATSIEIGNEPGGDFDDALYQRLFIEMAKGIRAGDPKMKIVTCTAHTLEADDYHKTLSETFSSKEIKSLFDVVNVHVYAQKPKKEGQSPWDRSYPEDPAIDYLDRVDAIIEWRDEHTPGKEIWITEFGYDACTENAMAERTGWFKKLNWTGVTDVEQARYIVRSLFCFAERDVERAYIYFFNDDDKASVHAASGLTRNFVPKPSFWAVKHLYETLGDYQFSRVVHKEEGRHYVYEFVHSEMPGKSVWVAWSPTGSERSAEVALTNLPGKLVIAETMPLNAEPAIKAVGKKTVDGITVSVSETPVYLHFEK